jgi:hypothetical protein
MRSFVVVVALCSRALADPDPTPRVTLETATQLLGEDAACKDKDDPILCLLEARYAADSKAKALALALYRDTGDVAGVGPEENMDGGFRGPIHLVPQLPTGKYRTHLAWLGTSLHTIDAFFAAFDKPPAYRWKPLALRFVRSVGKHTPSAYAMSWTIEYNVEGSLLRSEPSVRETVFHELFHLNDEEHGDWSAKTLGTDYDAIVAKCGAKNSCYTPYAPNDTKVIKTGAYYAFQQNNGAPVHEYAAELAVRYYKEQSEMRAKKRLSHKAFKCGPPENARAWQAFVDEFFAGQDLVPPCA